MPYLKNTSVFTIVNFLLIVLFTRDPASRCGTEKI